MSQPPSTSRAEDSSRAEESEPLLPREPSTSQSPPPRIPWRTVCQLLSLLPLVYILTSDLIARTRGTTNPRTAKKSDTPEVVELTLALARIPSPSGEEQAVFKFAHDWLSSRNVTVHTQHVPPLTPAHSPRRNILATIGEIAEVKVLLFTHLDTVPGGPAPSLSGETLIGRGVVDAKGQAAGMMLTFTNMSDPRVGLLLVCGEETDHRGIRLAAELGLSTGVTLVNGEPTEGRLVSRQKGAIRMLLKASGRRAHSGYPHLGESAILKLVDVINELRVLFDGQDGVTMNVGTIQGGEAANVVPGSAEANVLWRVVGRAEDVYDRVHGVLERHGNVTVANVKHNDALVLHVPTGLAEEFGVTEVAYNTDIPYYGGGYSRAVLFGGGSITRAHTENEWVAMAELSDGHARLQRVVGALL